MRGHEELELNNSREMAWNMVLKEYHCVSVVGIFCFCCCCCRYDKMSNDFLFLLCCYPGLCRIGVFEDTSPGCLKLTYRLVHPLSSLSFSFFYCLLYICNPHSLSDKLFSSQPLPIFCLDFLKHPILWPLHIHRNICFICFPPYFCSRFVVM